MSSQRAPGDDGIGPDGDASSDGARADDEQRVETAVALARRWVDDAALLDERSPRSQRRRRRRLAALVEAPSAADFTVRLTDEVSRMSLASRAARRFAELVHDADLSAMPLADRLLLRVGARVAPIAPRVVMPLVHRRLRAEADGVILPADDPGLADHLRRRTEEGIRSNVNVLGEAIVGDGEARRRLAMVTERLRRPDVDYVSVKISAVCASISPVAFDDTVERVVERLRPLYRCAASFDPPKFVNLDMEEYRDLDLTIAVFRELLDDEFVELDAGIVLQAYLPDSAAAALDLATWALERRERGGGRIKIRIVKGANLAMEHAAAELAGWPAAPYGTKAEVDANYKAVLDILRAPRFDDAVRIGVASHNLFDVAWALGLRDEQLAAGRPATIEFEMLEGMSPSQSAVVRAATGDLLLYSPIVGSDDFAAALAYLVRRLDENTAPDNFLAHIMELARDSEVFAAEAARFAASVHERHLVSHVSRRRGDRARLAPRGTTGASSGAFVNAPDTDWTSAANRAWIADALAADHGGSGGRAIEVVTTAHVDATVERSLAAHARWAATAPAARADLLERVADEFEAARGRVLAIMAAEAGKIVTQGDPEVSEAVDFARYYARDARRIVAVDGATAAPRGPIVVTPPWNFPFAIPAGGVLAALAAGNTAILKPAPQTRETARAIVELCWAAGVPDDVVQFLPAADDDAGRRLVTHPDVAAVILTGAYATAELFHSWRPDLRLHAETSGKNALVITAAADLDEAVADLVASAFGHAGQKCSAASLAIVEAPLYDDPRFLERIRDAAATLRVGPADDVATDVGPLIEPPGPALERALTELDPGERWLLRPELRSDDRRSWTPGVRVGVRPGSWFARTECFGPVLGIMRADDLDHAIVLQNGTEFGLTAGLHSLDPAEISTWVEQVEAGNLYVNRGITGAIVQRQPFGGWKRSVVGPTAKAGGPNYVATLAGWSDDPTVAIETVEAAFATWWRTIGRAERDLTGLTVERNVFRYRPLRGGVAVRFGPMATARQRSLVATAAGTVGCRLVSSEAADESEQEFAARVPDLAVDRYRSVGLAVESDVVAACHRAGVTVDDADPVAAPEIELPRWLREQAVSTTMHRHGRVDHRARRASEQPGDRPAG
ncbi:MAG: proline dehydrogenase family protein [Ilumatobacteraceae bacterium]|nr:proline dehydrogenase family protein [Ilumatobacteraceae bacterium]